MSFSVLQKGLELFEDNSVKEKVKSSKPSKKNKLKAKVKAKSSVDINGYFLNSKAHNVPVKRKIDENLRLESSVKILRQLDHKCSNNEHIEEVMKYHRKNIDKKYISNTADKSKKQTEEKSVFTDEDFERLNKEWLKLY